MSEIDRLADVFADSPVATGLQSRGYLPFVNRACASLMADTSANMADAPFLRYVAPAWRDMLRGQAALREVGLPSPSRYTVRLTRSDGFELDVVLHASNVSVDGEPATLFRLYSDVSAAERAEIERANSSFYRASFEFNSAVKLIVDPETGRVIDANTAACNFYGRTINEFRSLRAMDLSLESPTAREQMIQEARLGIRRFFQCQHTTKEGVRDVDVHVGTVRMGERHVLILVVFDATIQRAIDRANDQAARIALLGRAEAGIRHELRNLAFVLGHAAEAATRPDLAASISADLHTIAGRATTLLAELRELTGRAPEAAAATTRPIATRVEDLGRRLVRARGSLEGAVESAPSLEKEKRSTTHDVTNDAANNPERGT